MFRRPLLHRLDVQSVAVFRALPLGDMLCAVPALRALRWKLPQAHVILVGLPWAGEFARRFRDYIDEFIAFPGHPLLPEQTVRHEELAPFYADLCQRELGLALQLHGSGDITNEIVSGFGARTMAGCTSGEAICSDRTVLLACPATGSEPERLLGVVGQLGAEAVGDHLEFPVTFVDERELADIGIAAGLTPGRYICVHAGARHPDKCWAPEQFAEVAGRLAKEFRLAVVLIGADGESRFTVTVPANMRAPALDAATPISLGAMACLMRGARLLICNDSSVSHIAAGLKLNSVVVFGKAEIVRWAPPDRHRHRCIWDPGAERTSVVLEHARALLAGTEPSKQRTTGMWPYW